MGYPRRRLRCGKPNQVAGLPRLKSDKQPHLIFDFRRDDLARSPVLSKRRLTRAQDIPGDHGVLGKANNGVIAHLHRDSLSGYGGVDSVKLGNAAVRDIKQGAQEPVGLICRAEVTGVRCKGVEREHQVKRLDGGYRNQALLRDCSANARHAVIPATGVNCHPLILPVNASTSRFSVLISYSVALIAFR